MVLVRPFVVITGALALIAGLVMRPERPWLVALGISVGVLAGLGDVEKAEGAHDAEIRRLESAHDAEIRWTEKGIEDAKRDYARGRTSRETFEQELDLLLERLDKLESGE